MIEIDAGAGASLGLVSGHSYRFSADMWWDDFADDAVYPVMIADLGQLRTELDGEFWRLLARFAA